MYLLSTLPGCVPRPNLLDEDSAFESDVLVRNLTASPTHTSELFGRDFICECKNWKKPANVATVGYFLFRMHLTHCRFGVIFANSGVTGEKSRIGEEKAALALIRRAFHEDGITCVVVGTDELQQLADGVVTSFTNLLLKKVEIFQFGRASKRGAHSGGRAARLPAGAD